MKLVKLRLLGGFELAWTCGPALPTRKAEALLTYLAVPEGRAHQRYKLASLLWGDRSDTQARHSLAQTVHVIRKALGESGKDALISNAHTVALEPSFIDLDVSEFEALAAQSTPEAHAAAIRLYRGELFEGVSIREEAFEDWLLGEQRRLNTIALGTLEQLLDHQAAAGDDKAAIETAHKLLALDPLQEPVHRTLMRLNRRVGHEAAAIYQYQTCAKILKHELGIEPDAATYALYREIVDDRTVLPEEDLLAEKDVTEVAVQPSSYVASPALDRPSIAVLPFENLTSDPEQEHFADGIAEDIITALAKFRWFFVIARNSSFAYKGKSVGTHKIAMEIGVRYILEGSVRRDGDSIRVTGQLIDTDTGAHIWAERYDRDIEDLFVVQDQITESIVAAIAPQIGQVEIERARRKPPGNLDAWALYQRGLALTPSGDEEDFQAAIELFDLARHADLGFVDAIAMAAYIRTKHAYFYDPDNRDELLGEADQLLQAAMRLDPQNFICHMALGRLHYTHGEYDLAVAMAREAVRLNPNSALAHTNLGVSLFGANRYEESLKHKDIALRLSPNDPNRAGWLSGRAIALFMLGRYEECAKSALRSSRSPNPRYWSDSLAVAALTKLGRTAEAEAAKKALLERKPDFSVSEMEKFYYSAHPPEQAKDYCDALRDAGLPE